MNTTAVNDSDVVILAGSRTPQGRVNGQLAGLTAVHLGTAAIIGALARAEVKPEQVDFVLMGQVLQAGCGQNPARQSAIAAGIPWNVPAMTLNKVCLSGLAAVIDAARLLPVAYVVGAAMLVMGVVLIIGDLVVPIQLT